jgi:hypothetical protein
MALNVVPIEEICLSTIHCSTVPLIIGQFRGRSQCPGTHCFRHRLYGRAGTGKPACTAGSLAAAGGRTAMRRLGLLREESVMWRRLAALPADHKPLNWVTGDNV